MSSGIAWLRRRAGWSRVVAACDARRRAVLGALAGAPQPAAAAESAMPDALVGAPSRPAQRNRCRREAPAARRARRRTRPTLTLVAGTPQTAPLEAAFATGLQVALANSDGCPVTGAAGVPVTFSAPSSGASGRFSGSGSSAVTVGADATGEAAAPAFTADDVAGSYMVTASSPYGSLSFSLTNTAAGVPARVTAIAPARRSATVTRRYAQPLQVRVLDAAGAPVAGATVTFTLSTGTGTGTGAGVGTGASSSAAVSACDAGASASFVGGAGAQASATTGSSGIATSPSLTAGTVAGSFVATATAAASSGAGAGGSGGGVGTGAAASGATIEASFALSNLAGEPSSVTAGVGAMQSTASGMRFPMRLAVTVTDAEKNPVAGTPVTSRRPPGARAPVSRGARAALGIAPHLPSPHGQGRDRRVRHSRRPSPHSGSRGRLRSQGQRRTRQAGGVRARQRGAGTAAVSAGTAAMSARATAVSAAWATAVRARAAAVSASATRAPGRLRPSDLARVASVGLRTRRLRAALSALGIAIGVAAIVAVLGLSSSSQAGLLRQIDRLGTNLLTVTNGQGLSGKTAELPLAAPAMISRIYPVTTVAQTAKVTGAVYRSPLIPAADTNALTVQAASVNLPAALGVKLTQGEYLNAATATEPVAVLGAAAAQRLGIDRLYPGERIWLADQWFYLAGILGPAELTPEIESSVLVGFPAAERYLGVQRTREHGVRARPGRTGGSGAVGARARPPTRRRRTKST